LLGSWGWWWVALALLGIPGLGLVSWWRGRCARHLAEAQRLIAAGRADEATEWLDLPQAQPSTRDRALLLRARAAIVKGRPSEAVGPLEQIDPGGPLAAEAALWKGRTLFQVRQVLRAVHWFRQALTLRPDDPDAMRWLAAALYELGDHPSTVAALTRLTQLDHDDARAWRTLALLNKEDREFPRAQRAYEWALWLDPKQPLVRFELAETLLELGLYEQAEEQLAACRGGVPEPDRRALLVHCRLQRGGDTAQFRDLLDASLAEFPDHPGLLAYRARADLTEGHIARALDGFNRILAADPFRSRPFTSAGWPTAGWAGSPRPSATWPAPRNSMPSWRRWTG
jgi:predicted Zn-dependent protease